MKSTELRSTVISALRWTVISRLFMQLVTWSSTIIAVRILTPTDYGIFTVATVLSNFIALLGEAGLGAAIVQRQVRDRETLTAVFSLLVVVSSILAGIVFASAPFVASLFEEQRAVGVMRMVALTFLLLPFTTLTDSILRLDLRFRELGITQIVGAITSALTVVGLAILEAGPYALVAGVMSGQVTRVFVMLWYTKAPVALTLSLRPVLGLLRYSSLIVVDRTVAYWYAEADNAIIGRFLGSNMLGAFSLAKNVVQMPLDRIGGISHGISFPVYSRIKEKSALVAGAYLRSIRLGAYMFFPLFWGLGAVAEPLVLLAFGEKWQDSILPMQLLTIALPLRGLEAMSTPMLRAMGRPDISLRISVTACFVVIPALVLGVVSFGISGAAAAWAVAYPIVFCIVVSLISRTLALRRAELWITLIRPVVSAAIMATIVITSVYYFMGANKPLWQLLAGIGSGVVSYLAIIRIVDVGTFRELFGLVRSFFGRRASS